jgi:hypothetical protein
MTGRVLATASVFSSQRDVRSRRGILLSVCRRLLFACELGALHSVWISGGRTVVGFLSTDPFAGLFSNLIPMSAHVAAIPPRASREPLRENSGGPVCLPRLERRQIIH